MKKLLAGLALTLFASGSAFATGMYAAIDVGQGTLQNACAFAPAFGATCTEKGTATRVGIGFKLPLEILSIEASYGNLGKATATFPGATDELKSTGLQVSGIASFPVVPGAVSLFGKVGLANIKTTFSTTGAASVSDTNSNLTFGLGAEFTLLPVVDLRVQYEDLGNVGGLNTTGLIKHKLTMMTAGVTFKF